MKKYYSILDWSSDMEINFEKVSDKPSMTLPDQTFTVNQILERSKRGEPTNARATKFDVPDDVTDDVALDVYADDDNPDDLTAMQELKDEIEQKERERKAKQKAKQFAKMPPQQIAEQNTQKGDTSDGALSRAQPAE